MWSDKIVYICGSALKNKDLERTHIKKAKACFILSARHIKKKSESVCVILLYIKKLTKLFKDERTILRSWAIKDFAPNVPQYVQVFRPQTKIHLQHAKIIICEDEFKYSLLANNVFCPGISTFITLLMHTSTGQ